MWMGLGLLGLFASIISAVMLILSAIKRDASAAKKRGFLLVAFFIIFIIGVTLDNEHAVQTATPNNQPRDISSEKEKDRENAVKTIGVGAHVFKKYFNTAAKDFGFQIEDDKFRPNSETEYLESYKINLDDRFHLTFDVDKKSSEMSGILLSGNIKYDEESVGTLIRLIDATIAGVNKSITEDDRKQIIKQLGFDTSRLQDIQTLDKNVSQNGLLYSFTSTKDGDVAFVIGKGK